MLELPVFYSVLNRLECPVLKELKNIKMDKERIEQLRAIFFDLETSLKQGQELYQKECLQRQNFEENYQQKHPVLAKYRVKLSKELGLALTPNFVMIDEKQLRIIKQIYAEYLELTKKIEQNMTRTIQYLKKEIEINIKILKSKRDQFQEEITKEQEALKLEERMIQFREQVLKEIVPNKIISSCPWEDLALYDIEILEDTTLKFSEMKENLNVLSSMMKKITNFFETYQIRQKESKEKKGEIANHLRLHPLKKRYAKALFEYHRLVPNISLEEYNDFLQKMDEYGNLLSSIATQFFLLTFTAHNNNQKNKEIENRHLEGVNNRIFLLIKKKKEELSKRKQVIDYYGNMNLVDVVKKSQKVKK